MDCDTQGSAKHWSGSGRAPRKVEHRPLESGQNIEQWSAGIRAIEASNLVLDSPPHLDATLGGVIGPPDIALIPCGSSNLDLIATAETVTVVREIRKSPGDGNPLITLIPNRIDLRTASGRQLASALEGLGEVLDPAIHSPNDFADAFILAVWVGEYSIDEINSSPFVEPKLTF